MTRLLGRTPAWLWTVVELAGIGVLGVLNGLGKSWTGKTGGIALIIAFLTLVSAIAGRLQKWFSNRLQVRVNLEAPDQPLLADTLSGTLIDTWLEQRRNSCLKPLREAEERAEQQRQREEMRKRDFQVNHPLGEGVAIPNFSAIMQEFQRTSLYAGQTAFASGYRPESREPDEYKREVDEHLDKARTVLTNLLTHSYVQSQLGLLRLRPVNKTDRTLKEVSFLLRLPQHVKAIDPDKLGEQKPLPKPPRPYGTSERTTSFLNPAIRITGLARRSELADLGPGVGIEDTPSGSVVTYSPVNLRAKDHETVLPEVHLYLSQDAGPGPLIVEWEATADNAEGRVSGRFELTIGSTPLPAAGLLQDALPDVEGPSLEAPDA